VTTNEVIYEKGTEVFEVKFAIPRQETAILISTLRHNAQKPPQFSRAKIKTIYFDDHAHTSFTESSEGEITKRKYRLRVYMDRTDGARYSLEIKKRDDRVTGKVRELIYEELPPGYELTTFHSLVRAFEDITGRTLTHFKSELPPKELFADTVVYYDRIRFDDRHGPVRYNVDTSIRVFPGPVTAKKRGDGLCLDHDIFEIKSKNPDLVPYFLRGLSLEPLSFSKFAWGKELLV